MTERQKRTLLRFIQLNDWIGFTEYLSREGLVITDPYWIERVKQMRDVQVWQEAAETALTGRDKYHKKVGAKPLSQWYKEQLEE